MSSDDEREWVCPACGKPDSDLPVGHSVAFPMDGGKPTCIVLPPPDPDIIARYRQL